MSSRISAGIVLFRRAGGTLEVLLAHPGGPYFAARDEDVWSIPKGEVEPDETLYDVARREFEEETGHQPPDGPPIELGSIVQKGGKVVHGWALEGDLDPALARSNT
ncbi:MAG: NUDIX domain-containing protein, partial [Candidatus Limnocylindrales bacterium]